MLVPLGLSHGGRPGYFGLLPWRADDPGCDDPGPFPRDAPKCRWSLLLSNQFVELAKCPGR